MLYFTTLLVCGLQSAGMKAVLSKLARQRTIDATAVARTWVCERLEQQLTAGSVAEIRKTSSRVANSIALQAYSSASVVRRCPVLDNYL